MPGFVVDLFLRGMALCLLAAVALFLLRRSAAAYRHLLCVLALSVLPLLPLAQRLAPPLRVLPARQATVTERVTAPLWEAGRPFGHPQNSASPVSRDLPPEQSFGTTLPPLDPVGNIPAARSAAPPAPASPHSSWLAAALLGIVWGIGAFTLLIRLLVALIRLRQLEMESHPSIRNGVPIRISEQISTPLTWGIRRSIILLPAKLLSGERGVCESALRHEQAHIARWDWMWNLLAELVCSLCWFQPGVWWLRSRMRLESERACDDRVLLSGVGGPDYAAHLLQIVRSACTSEVAPAMAQSHGLEERMRHILDAARPRHAQTTWLVVSAPFALVLLSLAALRVSARPQGAKHPAGQGAISHSPGRSPSGPKTTADPAGEVQAQGAPAAPLEPAIPEIRLENVVWGKAVDGLEPGLWLNAPWYAKDRRTEVNAYVNYKVLVRNTTRQERQFEVQCWNRDALDIPYLIPDGDMPRAMDSRTLSNRYRATGASSRASGEFPAYAVRLAPGEAIVVPGEPGLYIGAADKQRFPRIEKIEKGMNWIVQPVTIHPLTTAERALAAKTSKTEIVILDRDGNSARRSFSLVPARSGGRQLLAGIQLEVGTNWDRTLTTHSPSINAVSFSPDSKRLVTGGTDGSAIVWNAVSGRSLLTLKGRTAAISSIRYTPDGKSVLTGCTDGAIHIWDAATGKKQHTLTGPGGGVCALDISADGTKLLGGYDTGKVKVWDTSTGQAPVTFTYDNRLLSAAISLDGKSVAAGYRDATLQVWDLQTRQSLFTEKFPQSEGVTGLHFDRLGYLYTWNREEMENPEETHPGKLKITALTTWGVRPRRRLSRVSFPEPPGTVRHAVTYESLAMAFGLAEGQAVLNNMHDGPVAVNAHEGPVVAVAVSPDGRRGATGGRRNGSGEAKIWDMEAHKPTGQAK